MGSIPWQDETPFGSPAPPPGGGDTAIFGDYNDPLSPGGPTGITVTASGVTVGTLEAGHVTLDGTITATDMEFGGFGSGNVTLAGGTFQTGTLNGAVNITGASLNASGASQIFAYLTGSGTLTGTTGIVGGTVDAGCSATFSGDVTNSFTVQNGGTLATGASLGGPTIQGAGSTWTANGITNGVFLITGGGAVTCAGAQIEDDGFNAGEGLGLNVNGTGSRWTINGTLNLGDVAGDTGALTVVNGGTVSATGPASLGTGAGSGGMLFVQGVGSTLTTGALTGTNGSLSVTAGGQTITNGNAIIDQQNQNVLNSAVTGAGSLWHVTGNLTLGNTGQATLNVGVGSLLQADGDLTLANAAANSTANLSINGPNGLNVSGDTTIGNAGNAELDITGGNGTGNYATLGGNFYIGGGGGSASGTAVGTVHNQQGALAVTNSADVAIVGVGKGDMGELFISNSGGTAALAGQLIVGLYGQAVAGVTLGGVATTGNTAVATAGGSIGELDVFDPGSMWTCSELDAGGLEDAQPNAGTGTVAANNYGLIRALQSFYISPTALVYVSAAVPANTNTSFKYKFAPSDTTHAGAQIFVGSDDYGPDATIRVGTGGTLYGQAKNLTGNVTVGAEGRFKPGDGLGTFTITGDCDLDDNGHGGGETDIQLGGSDTPGTGYDQLIVSGSVTLGGTLNVSLKDGYKPAQGDKFHVIQTDAISGSFAQVVSPGLVLLQEPDEDGLTLEVSEVAIGSPPDITSPATATGTVGQPLSYQIVADNAPFSYGATGLPAGLSVNTSIGLISGTPTAAGVYTVALAAKNSQYEADGTLTLTVDPAPPAGSPVITSVTNATGKEGTAFTYQISATNMPTSFGATGLPAGLTVAAATGLISGTPAAGGVFSVVLSAANATGTGVVTLTLAIPAPVVTLAAAVPQISVGGGRAAAFILSVSPAQSSDLMIKYTIKGSAKPGTDYVPLTGSAKLKAGKTTKIIKITPLGDLGGASKKTIKLTLAPGSGYIPGTTVPVKVKITAP